MRFSYSYNDIRLVYHFTIDLYASHYLCVGVMGVSFAAAQAHPQARR